MVAFVACTGGEDPPFPQDTRTSASATPPCPSFVLSRNDGDCADTFELDGATFRVTCVAVPEVLLDVAVPARWGGGAVRAIAAVPPVQGVAVTADDPTCGAYALAVRTDLPTGVAAAIAREMERAASLPPDVEG